MNKELFHDVNTKYGPRIEEMTKKYKKRNKTSKTLFTVGCVVSIISLALLVGMLLIGGETTMPTIFGVFSVLSIVLSLCIVVKMRKSNQMMFNKLRKEYLPKLYPGFRYDFSYSPRYTVQQLQHNSVDLREDPWLGLTVLPEGKLKYFVSGLTSKETGLKFYECSIESKLKDSSGLFDSESFEGVVGIVKEYDDVLLSVLKDRNLWRYIRLYDGKLVILLEGMSFDFVWELMNGDSYHKLEETMRGNHSMILEFMDIIGNYKKFKSIRTRVLN